MTRIAIVQDDCILGETGRNIEKASGLIKRAAHQDAALVLFPEMYLYAETVGWALLLERQAAAHDLAIRFRHQRPPPANPGQRFSVQGIELTKCLT